MRIAFQGAAGAYSESAAQRAWPGCETAAHERFEDVFAAVQAGVVSHGILPVENSVGGSIHRNYDLLLEHEPAWTRFLIEVERFLQDHAE